MPGARASERPAAAAPTSAPGTQRREAQRSRRLLFVVAFVGAAAWLAMFEIRLARVPESLWFARDDAVITLSHARNLAEFGTIGVSPGDRVEGFSSPLQFGAAAAVFRAASMDYRTFLELFIATTVSAMGALVALAIHLASRGFGVARARSAQLAILLSVVVALLTLSTWTTTGWLVSGMENPLVVVAGLAVAVFALSDSTRLPNTIGAITALALLGIARVELAAFVAPLVFAVALVQAQKAPAVRRRLSFVLTAATPLTLIAAVHVARRLYFGSWLPNTAVVQGRAQDRDQLILLAALCAAMGAGVLRTALASAPRGNRAANWARTVSTIACAAFAAGAAWMTLAGQSKGSLTSLLALPGLRLLVALLLVLTFAARFAGRPWLQGFVFGGAAFIPLSQYLVMGPARLDDFRIASLAVPLLATWAAVMAAKLISVGWPAVASVPGRARLRWSLLPLSLVVVAGLVLTSADDGPRYLNWEIGDSKELLAVADSVRASELGGTAMPILANPDLGKLSFTKKALVVDLGYLGDPMLTELNLHRSDLIATYLNDVAAPDVVQLHADWSCIYTVWFESAGFQEGWKLSDDRWLQSTPTKPECPLGGRYSVFTRVAPAEYALTRRVTAARHPDAVVRAALAECSATPGSPFRCQPVRRAVQRNAQLLRQRGQLGAVLGALESSPSALLDQRLVARGPSWGVEAFREFTKLAS